MPAAAQAAAAAATSLYPYPSLTFITRAHTRKIRGKCNRYLGKWEAAQTDLAKAMSIDFDPDMQDLLKFVQAKFAAIQAKGTKKRMIAPTVVALISRLSTATPATWKSTCEP